MAVQKTKKYVKNDSKKAERWLPFHLPRNSMKNAAFITYCVPKNKNSFKKTKYSCEIIAWALRDVLK
jgi:hypothetical protein